MTLLPRKPVPSLEFDTVGASRWSLADQKPEHFTMVVSTAASTARSAIATPAN